MLDVHPPQHPAHSWKDFSIHIATIVIGLLIAIGLEQTVEWIHHRREMSEARESLRTEREKNRKDFAVNVAEFRVVAADIRNNLLVLSYLQQHPGTPESKLPGTLRFGFFYAAPVDSAWQSLERTQVIALLPQEEVQRDAFFYLSLEQNGATIQALAATLIHTTSSGILDPDLSHMTPRQVDEEIAVERIAAEADFFWGIRLLTLNLADSRFQPPPTLQELGALVSRERKTEERKALAQAQALTDARTSTADAAYLEASKASERD